MDSASSYLATASIPTSTLSGTAGAQDHSLVEPGVEALLKNALHQAHVIRESFHIFVFNVGLLIVFVLCTGGLLVYKYKGKRTLAEIEQANKEKHRYVLERIKTFQHNKLRAQQQLLTGLPHWEP